MRSTMGPQRTHGPSIEQRIAALEAGRIEDRRRIAILQTQVVELLAARPRDRYDTDLRQLLPTSTKGLLFGAGHLMTHAGVDPALDAVLRNACIGSAGELGAWLRSQRGTRDGVLIERVRRQWRATYTCDT